MEEMGEEIKAKFPKGSKVLWFGETATVVGYRRNSLSGLQVVIRLDDSTHLEGTGRSNRRHCYPPELKAAKAEGKEQPR